MAIDWIGFAYASMLVVGGVVAYTRKGSKISLAAGVTFGSVAGYGAYCVTCDPRNVKISLWLSTGVDSGVRRELARWFNCSIKNARGLCHCHYFDCKSNKAQLPMRSPASLPTSRKHFSFIFSFDHYNGNEVQEVQEINASRTSSMPEPFDDFEACFYAAVGEFSNLRTEYNCHAH